MELFLVAFAIVAITVICFKGIKMFNYLDNMAGIMEMIPGPTPYPFVGNLFQFGLKPEEYTKKILQYCRKYDFQGYRSLVFFQYQVILSDPAEIQSILSSSSLVYKEHLYSFLRPWLGDGLLTSSGAQWVKHQQLYLPAFDKNAIEGYMHVVNKTGIKLVQKLKAYAKNGQMFDVQSLMQMCTLDIVSEIATGTPSTMLDNQPSELNKAVMVLCDIVKDRTFSIVKRFDTLFRLTPYYGKQKRALDSLKSEINQIAGQIKSQTDCDSNSDGKMQNLYPTNGPEAELKPFINVLLNATLDGRKLKSNEIIEEISTFIFTGSDPVAAALSFTLYTLSRHPAIQLKVYEEQQNIFNTKSGDELRNVNAKTIHLNEMIYLEMVLRETLRLYPAVPLIARTNREPIDINGTKITNSTTIILCLIAMGYNDKYFGNPCEFRPERFDSKSKEAGANALRSVPFSAGPRKCIAEKFAIYELKSLLARLIRHYEILQAAEGLASGINDHSQQDCQPQSEYDPILNIRVTLKSENGILIRLKERK